MTAEEAEAAEAEAAAAANTTPQTTAPTATPQAPASNGSYWKDNYASDRNVPKLTRKSAKEFRDFVREVEFWELELP